MDGRTDRNWSNPATLLLTYPHMTIGNIGLTGLFSPIMQVHELIKKFLWVFLSFSPIWPKARPSTPRNQTEKKNDDQKSKERRWKWEKHTRTKHIDDPSWSLWADQRAKNGLYLVPWDSPPPTHRTSLHATVYYMLPFALGFGLLTPASESNRGPWHRLSFTLLFPLFYFSFFLSLPNSHFTLGWKSG